MVELSPGASVAIGVIVGLASTCIQSIGLTLQRKSHLLEEEKEEDDERRPPYKRRRWQLGMLMFVVANIVGSTIQITTLPLPVLSTLQASGLVFNSICASLVLKEPFTRFSFGGTVLVAVGALMIGIFGAISEPSHNLNQLLELLGRHQFLIWMFGTLLIVIFLVFGNWFLKRIYIRPTPRLRLVRGISFGLVSGVLSAHSLLIAKSAVELLVRTIVDRHNQFNRWQSWMILIGLVVFALTQLYFMHRGLKLCSTSVLYPLVFCIYNIVAIIDGLIYFHQSSRLSNLHAGLLALGTLILLAGVVALSWRLEGDEDEEPSSPHSTRHKGNVPIPQTVLTPGIGLVQGTLGEDEPLDIEQEPRRLRSSEHHQHKRRSAHERTPLLARNLTDPLTPKTSESSKRLMLEYNLPQSSHASPSPQRRPGRRRTTVSEDTNVIWDELNDRDTLLSPARRSVDLERRPRFSTLPTRRKNKSTSWLSQMRRASWFDNIPQSSQHRRSLPVISPQLRPDDDVNSSQADTVASYVENRRTTWAFPTKYQSQNSGSFLDWFKPMWWRKKRTPGDGEERS